MVTRIVRENIGLPYSLEDMLNYAHKNLQENEKQKLNTNIVHNLSYIDFVVEVDAQMVFRI